MPSSDMPFGFSVTPQGVEAMRLVDELVSLGFAVARPPSTSSDFIVYLLWHDTLMPCPIRDPSLRGYATNAPERIALLIGRRWAFPILAAVTGHQSCQDQCRRENRAMLGSFADVIAAAKALKVCP